MPNDREKLMGKILALNLKTEDFKQIQSGTKTEEYRLFNDFWAKRLENREYDKICICLGYPKKNDTERRLIFPWRGYTLKTVTHPQFGSSPVNVFAIRIIRKRAFCNE